MIELEESMHDAVLYAVLELYQVPAIRESGETIGLLHDHTKTGSFSVRSRFCPFEYKIYTMYRYFYQVPAKNLYAFLVSS